MRQSFLLNGWVALSRAVASTAVVDVKGDIQCDARG
jgi:hypothetical protein